MLEVLTRQLQKLSIETYKLLFSKPHTIKASQSEIKALYARYSEGLDLLKRISIQLRERKSLLNKRYQSHSELLEESNTH